MSNRSATLELLRIYSAKVTEMYKMKCNLEEEKHSTTVQVFFNNTRKN